MVTIARIVINNKRQIILPLELDKELGLQNNDWLRVSSKSGHKVLIPTRVELDDEIVEDFIHQGIVLDVIQNDNVKPKPRHRKIT